MYMKPKTRDDEYGSFIEVSARPTGKEVADAVTLIATAMLPTLKDIEYFEVIVKPRHTFDPMSSWTIGVKVRAKGKP